MKKSVLVLIPIIIILGASLAEASIASLSVSWQLPTSTLRPSSISTISLTVTNTGLDLTDVVITPTAGPYIKITSGSKNDIGGLAAATTAQSAISIKVDDNVPSTTSYVYLQVDYYTGSSSYEKTFYIPLVIIREPILQISNVNFSSDLEPGKSVTLYFNLNNEGMGNAKDITVSLPQTSNFITSESSGEFFIDNLASGESKTLTFPITVSPSAIIGTATLPVKLSYYDETRTNVYNDTKQIGALIKGKYNFIVTVDSQDVLTTDTSGSITIKIANAGNEQADFLAVKVIPPNSIDISPSYVYVGNLNSDDYDSEKLSMNVGSVSPGNYPISLQLTYKDSFGNPYSEIYSVNAQVSTKAEYSMMHPSSPSSLLIIVVVIVIIGVIIIWRKGLFKKK